MVQPSQVTALGAPCVGWKLMALLVSVQIFVEFILLLCDSFSLTRSDDCIDSIGLSNLITKLELLAGPTNIQSVCLSPLTSLFQYDLMAFGVRNEPATFQHLMLLVLGDVPNCNVYLDDAVVYSHSWAEHVSSLSGVFQWLAEASLILNLAKCEFGQATVTYLGKQAGSVQVCSGPGSVVISCPVHRT